jgi:hypothetical protein
MHPHCGPTRLSPYFCSFFFFLMALGFELGLTLEPLHQSFFFCKGYFSRKGFVNYLPGAGFKPWCSWSLPPE